MKKSKLKKGWLGKQLKQVEEDFKSWPLWMQRESMKDHSIKELDRGKK